MTARLLLLLLLSLASIHADDAGIFIRFGFTDTSSTTWDGSITTSEGKVVSLEGWRFEAQDKVTSGNEWKADTRPLTQRKTRGNNPAKLGQRQQEVKEAMADNGVIAQLTGIKADTQITVKTAQGEFVFKLSDVTMGKLLPQLGGKVGVERVAFTSRLTPDDNLDDDFPAIAVDKDGTTWVAYTSFTPGLDRAERAKNLTKEPGSFDDLARPTGGDQVRLTYRKAG